MHHAMGRMISRRSFASLVDLESTDDTRIKILTLNRAPVNSMNTQLLQDITNAVKSCESDPEISSIVFASPFKSVFTAGLDLNEMRRASENFSEDNLRTFWKSLQDLWITLYGSSLVTVAEIGGHAPAGGTLIAISCDARVAIQSDAFVMGLNEAAFGLVAPRWFATSLRDVVGSRKADEMLQKGSLIPLHSGAFRIGLVDQVEASPEDLRAASISTAKSFLKSEPKARHASKLMLRSDAIAALETNRDADVEWFLNVCLSESVQDALETYVASLKKKK